MSKALRWSEKWFRFGLWLVAVVFASAAVGGAAVYAAIAAARAQLANVTHAVVNYVRRVAFNAAVDTRGMSFLPPVPVSDIRRFLLGSASALGIGRLDEIDAIVALVIDRIVVAGTRERMFRGFDRETGMQLPEETRLQLARRGPKARVGAPSPH